MVVLVDLTVDNGLLLIVVCAVNLLVLDCWVDSLLGLLVFVTHHGADS